LAAVLGICKFVVAIQCSGNINLRFFLIYISENDVKRGPRLSLNNSRPGNTKPNSL